MTIILINARLSKSESIISRAAKHLKHFNQFTKLELYIKVRQVIDVLFNNAKK